MPYRLTLLRFIFFLFFSQQHTPVLLHISYLQISQLLSLCGNVYSSHQMIALEIKILRVMDFQLHSIEPSICVNCYLYLLRINKIEVSYGLCNKIKFKQCDTKRDKKLVNCCYIWRLEQRVAMLLIIILIFKLQSTEIYAIRKTWVGCFFVCQCTLQISKGTIITES